MSISSKPQDSLSEFQPPTYISTEQFTSAFYHDPTEEEYAVARAFQSNNYNYIRKLPDQIKPGEVLGKRLDRARAQMRGEEELRKKPYEQKMVDLAEKAQRKKLEKIGTLGFFQLFPYQESPYGLAKQLAFEEHKESVKQREKICEIDFRPSDIEKKGKYEDPFGYHDKLDLRPRDNTEYLYPFHSVTDTFDVMRESSTRQRIVSESTRIAGPFLPSMKQKTLNDVHKTKIDDILTDIEFALKKHMKDYAYIVGVNKRDHIEILFEQIHERDLKLKAFMSNFCQHPIVSKYKLRRDLQNWGIIENQYILFTVVPPWVTGYTIASTSLNQSKM